MVLLESTNKSAHTHLKHPPKLNQHIPQSPTDIDRALEYDVLSDHSPPNQHLRELKASKWALDCSEICRPED